MYNLSRYSFVFNKNGQYFIYNSRINNFYIISEEAFTFIRNYSNNRRLEISEEERSFLDELVSSKIFQTVKDDNAYYEEQKLLYNISVMSLSHLSLTIVPTIACNLRCPYCFEQDKPVGFMSDKVIGNLIDFVKSHEAAKNYSISWFGGEPLLGLKQMEKLLERFDKLEGLKRVSHSIVTNATLLDDKAIDLFKRYPLGSMQVTLDGFRKHHDAKRFHADGSGTFDEILDNVARFMDECPDTFVSFRVNVDNSNSDDYIEVFNLLKKRFEGKRYGVYAGILRANRGCESETFFTTKDHLAFNRRMVEKGILPDKYPAVCPKGCCATSVSSYVIGPKGELYNCWEHVGKDDKIIGNISADTLSNNALFADFINNGHCFEDPKCRECGLLPICTGGCANKRIENLRENARHDLCTIYSDNDGEALAEVLYQYYLTKNGGKN